MEFFFNELLRRPNHSHSANISLQVVAPKALKTLHFTTFFTLRRHSEHGRWAKTLQWRWHIYSNYTLSCAAHICFQCQHLTFQFELEEFYRVLNKNNNARQAESERPREKEREREMGGKKKYRENDSQSTSRCSVIASDSTFFPSTTDDSAVTFAS